MDNGLICLIVEGDGEEKAARVLTRKILHEYYNRYDILIDKPAINAHGRGGITGKGGLEKLLELNRRNDQCAGVLVLLDTEKENRTCPANLAYSLAKRALILNLPFPVVVVCATCEYESWFLHNLDSIAPRYLNPEAHYSEDPEHECSAKAWLSRHMPIGRIYKETEDQEKMTSLIDILPTIEKSRSFRRLVNAIGELLDAIDSGKTVVTPLDTNNP